MIGEKLICGLDIGSQQVKSSVVKAKGSNRFDLLGFQANLTKGFTKSTVSDLAELSQCIYENLHALEKKAGIKLKDVYLGVGGCLIDPRYSKAIIPLIDRGSKIVTISDVKRINKQARLLGVKLDEEILHDFPQQYVVDDMNRVLNPTGLYGHKLGVTSLLITANVNLMSNLSQAVNQAGYEVAGVFLASLASAEASLTKNMVESGCLLIDVGASTTNLMFFRDGFLKHLDIIMLGGNHLTMRIAESLHLPFDLAEDIKKSQGAVLSEGVKGDDEILIKKEDQYKSVKRSVVCGSFEGEVEKLISAIENTIKFSHLQDKLNGGIIMVGGGSLLAGLIEHVEKRLNCTVRMGKAHTGGVPVGNAALFTACIGLTQMKAAQIVGQSLSAHSRTNWVNRISGRIMDLYEEYF